MAYAYKRIRLGKGITRDLHRILMEWKLGRRLDKNEIVHHKNENGKDNTLDNLEIISRGDHARMHYQGSRSSSAILNEDVVHEIKKLTSTRKKSQKEIARQYGVSKSTIADIAVGRTWRHVA